MLFMIILRLVIIVLAFILGIKATHDKEKLSPFECGFTPQSYSRSPFSIHFFLIAIIFLIFDIELVLLFPILINSLITPISQILFIVILGLLRLGVFLEWSQKMLDWANFKQSFKHFVVTKEKGLPV